MSAFVKSDHVYVRNCNDTFGCVCLSHDITVYSEHDESSSPLSTLTSDTCSGIKGRVQVCGGDIWIPVETDSGTGWIKNDEVHFYPFCQTTSGCPRIRSREEWNASDVLEVDRMDEAPRYAIIHHTAGSRCDNRERCAAIIQYIQQLHMKTNRWADIGYNFIIGEDGAVYEGRGWNVQGAHTASCNQRSLGIAFFGNFENTLPNTAALNALRSLLACAVRMGHLAPDYKLFGRRDWNRRPSESPGRTFNNLIRTWGHYNRTDICV